MDDPFSTQGFTYANANPMRFVDPDGRRSTCDLNPEALNQCVISQLENLASGGNRQALGALKSIRAGRMTAQTVAESGNFGIEIGVSSAGRGLLFKATAILSALGLGGGAVATAANPNGRVSRTGVFASGDGDDDGPSVSMTEEQIQRLEYQTFTGAGGVESFEEWRAKYRGMPDQARAAALSKASVGAAQFVEEGKRKQGPGVARGGAKLESVSVVSRARIQEVADEFGIEISLVGSRAAGKPKARDFDFVVPRGTSKKTIRRLKRRLPRGTEGGEIDSRGRESGIDVIDADVQSDKPSITFPPRSPR